MYCLIASHQEVYSDYWSSENDYQAYDLHFCFLLIKDEKFDGCFYKWCEGKLHDQPWGKTGKISDDEFSKLLDISDYPACSLPLGSELIPFIPQK